MKILIRKDSAKKVFILEDDDSRIEFFKKKFEYAESLFITQDVETAKKVLTDSDFDVIFLDHDLGGKQFVDSLEAETGYQVALTLKDTKNKNKCIIIHSMNPSGAENIYSVLSTAVKVPYYYLVRNLEIN